MWAGDVDGVGAGALQAPQGGAQVGVAVDCFTVNSAIWGFWVGTFVEYHNVTNGKCLEISDSGCDNGEVAQQWAWVNLPGTGCQERAFVASRGGASARRKHVVLRYRQC